VYLPPAFRGVSTHDPDRRNVERVCFLGRVRAERLAEYTERHERVWPDMLAALREAGWPELDGRPPDQGFRRIDEIFHVD
jgi:L-rhamnose mutarotase